MTSVHIVFGRVADNNYTGGDYIEKIFPPDEYSDTETKINIYNPLVNLGKKYPSIRLEKPTLTHENQFNQFGLIEDFKYTLEYKPNEPNIYDYVSQSTYNYYLDLHNQYTKSLYGYSSPVDYWALHYWVKENYNDLDFYEKIENYDFDLSEYKIFSTIKNYLLIVGNYVLSQDIEIYRYPNLEYIESFQGYVLNYYDYVIPFDLLFTNKGFIKHDFVNSSDSNYTNFKTNQLGFIQIAQTLDCMNLDENFQENEINEYWVNEIIFFNNGYFFFTPIQLNENEVYLKVYFCQFYTEIQNGASSITSEQNNIISQLPDITPVLKTCCLLECFGITE